MLRSRVLSGIDTARLATAVARPGIDPRVWVSYAILASDPVVVTTANEQDVVVDVILLPSGTVETARVGAAYAGNGFGLYMPLKQDDEVLVAAPSGDPDEGMVVIQRLWSPADLPPQAVVDNPTDVTLVVEPGKNLRLNVQGAGNVYMTVDTGKVFLGSADGTEPAAKGTSLKAYLDALVTQLLAHTHTSAAPGQPTSPPVTPITGPTTALLATTTEVK